MSSRPAIARPAAAAEPAFRAVGRLIKQVFSSLVRGVDQHMQPLELTAMQWEPILLLLLERADTVAALARESNVNCGAMTRMLDRLEEKQLVRRRRSADDRRVVHLELTDKGRRAGDERAIGGASLCVNGHAASFGYVLARAPWRARDTSRYALTRDEWKPSRRRDVRG